MAKFAKKDPTLLAKAQAENVMQELKKYIGSLGTQRGYKSSLKQAALFANLELDIGLRDMSVEHVLAFLEVRKEYVKQATLKYDKNALQSMLRNLTGQLSEKETIKAPRSLLKTNLASRSYTAVQVELIIACQRDKNALSTALVYAAGLRTHELLTLRLASERPAHIRKLKSREALKVKKFSLRDGVRYTVQGKGGLIREVLIPYHLHLKLEAVKLSSPKSAKDRGIYYKLYYDLSGGQRWSNSFASASKRALGWNNGGHGLRHSYAQTRMSELQTIMVRDDALGVVSLEMGHFRKEITEVYLR